MSRNAAERITLGAVGRMHGMDRWFGAPTSGTVGALFASLLILPFTIGALLGTVAGIISAFVGALHPVLLFTMLAAPVLVFLQYELLRMAASSWRAFRPADEALLVRGLLFTKEIPWSAIASVSLQANGYLVSYGTPAASKTLLLSIDMPDVQVLVQAIRRLAPALEEKEGEEEVQGEREEAQGGA